MTYIVNNAWHTLAPLGDVVIEGYDDRTGDAFRVSFSVDSLGDLTRAIDAAEELLQKRRDAEWAADKFKGSK